MRVLMISAFDIVLLHIELRRLGRGGGGAAKASKDLPLNGLAKS
jgi:hypothetical protein